MRLLQTAKAFYTSLVLMFAAVGVAHAAPPLVIYAAVGYDTAVAKAFQQATGIQVKVVTMSTGPLLARVQAERLNPQWDLVWFDGPEGMRSLAGQGLLAAYAPKADWNDIGRRIQPADHVYVASAATLAGVIVVNKKALPEADWPHSWDDLSKPKYRGKIGMNNPAVSGPTYPFVAGQLLWKGGEAPGKQWYLALKANGLKTFRTNSVTLRALDYGEIDVALVQNSAALGRTLRGMPFKVIYPNPVTLLPRVIGISSHATPAVRAEARRFIDFLLSKQGQAIAQKGDPTGDSLYYPVVAGDSPLPGVRPLRGVQVQTVDAVVWGPREGAIDRWFTNHIVH